MFEYVIDERRSSQLANRSDASEEAIQNYGQDEWGASVGGCGHLQKGFSWWWRAAEPQDKLLILRHSHRSWMVSGYLDCCSQLDLELFVEFVSHLKTCFDGHFQISLGIPLEFLGALVNHEVGVGHDRQFLQVKIYHWCDGFDIECHLAFKAWWW